MSLTREVSGTPRGRPAETGRSPRRRPFRDAVVEPLLPDRHRFQAKRALDRAPRLQGPRSAGRLPGLRGRSPAPHVRRPRGPHLGGDGRPVPAGGVVLSRERRRAGRRALDRIRRRRAPDHGAGAGDRSGQPFFTALDGQEARRSRRSAARSRSPFPASKRRSPRCGPEASKRTYRTTSGAKTSFSSAPPRRSLTAPPLRVRSRGARPC